MVETSDHPVSISDEGLLSMVQEPVDTIVEHVQPGGMSDENADVIQQNYTNDLKPSLWRRLMDSTLGHQLSTSIIGTTGKIISNRNHIYQGFGGAPTTSNTGSVSKHDLMFIAYCRRSLTRLGVLVISLYIAILIIHFTGLDKKMTGAIGNVDSDNEDELPTSYNKRFGIIIVVYIFWLIFGMVIYIGFKNMFWGILAIRVHMNAGKNENAEHILNEKWTWFWKEFVTLSGMGNMLSFDKLIIIATYGMLCFVILYLLFVKSFVNQIGYPDYYRDADGLPNKEKEFTTICKFLFHQLAFIIVFLLLMLCFEVHKQMVPLKWSGFWKGAYLVGTCMIIAVYSTLFSLIIYSGLRKVVWQIALVIFFVCLCCAAAWLGAK